MSSPGIPISHPVIQKSRSMGISVIGDIEIFARVVDAPVIAITGTNGKSTVTTLVGEMAREAGIKVAVAGNIGVPVLDLINPVNDLNKVVFPEPLGPKITVNSPG